MSFVLDTSVAIAWCFKDETTSATEELLTRVTMTGAAAPAFWSLEATNVLLMAEKRGRMNDSQRRTQTAFLQGLPVTPDLAARDLAWTTIADLAAQYKLTSYDAAYLELALRRQMPLATLDQELRRAAAAAGVELLGA